MAQYVERIRVVNRLVKVVEPVMHGPVAMDDAGFKGIVLGEIVRDYS